MNAVTCQKYRHWLAESGSHGVSSLPMRKHAQSCDDCRRLEDTLDGAVRGFDAQTHTHPPAFDAASLRAGIAARRKDRQRHASIRRWAACAAVLVLGAAAWFSLSDWNSGSPEVARVVSVEGALGGVGVGDAVLEGQRVETGAMGRAVLAAPSIASVSIDARSAVVVERWSPTETILVLERGAVRAEVVHREPGQTFAVRTERGLVRVVGTVFDVIHEPGGETRVEVIEGVVQVEGPDGEVLSRLSAGSVTTLRKPTPPAPTAPQRAEIHKDTHEVIDTEPAPVVLVPEPPAKVRRAPRAQRRAPTERKPVLHPEPIVEETTDVETPEIAPSPEEQGRDALIQGRKLLASGQDSEAIQVLEGAVVAGATPRAPLLTLLGDAYSVSGRATDALPVYEKALDAYGDAAPAGLIGDMARLLDKAEGHRPRSIALWRRYLAQAPGGVLAPRAMWSLSVHASAVGNVPEADRWLQALCDRYPSTPQGRNAFARIGRKQLARHALSQAEAHFQTHMGSPDGALAETALIGMARVRIGQGRLDEALAILARYDARFPAGVRQPEAARLRTALEP